MSPSEIVGVPSLIKTMTAGAGLSVDPFGTLEIADNAVVMPAAVAVPPPTVSDLSAVRTGAVSVLGGTSRAALPLNVTRPIWTFFGTFFTNSVAWSSIAWSRDGETSVELIDADVSSASMIVARSFAVRIAIAGWANANVRRIRDSARAPAGTWRCQPERFGATESSRSTLVKRRTWVCRRRWTTT